MISVAKLKSSNDWVWNHRNSGVRAPWASDLLNIFWKDSAPWVVDGPDQSKDSIGTLRRSKYEPIVFLHRQLILAAYDFYEDPS